MLPECLSDEIHCVIRRVSAELLPSVRLVSVLRVKRQGEKRVALRTVCYFAQ